MGKPDIARLPVIQQRASVSEIGAISGQAVLDGQRLLRLHGRLDAVYPQGIARIRFDAPNGNSAIRDGLDWLLASAAGLDTSLVQFHDGGDAGAGLLEAVRTAVSAAWDSGARVERVHAASEAAEAALEHWW